MSEDNVYTVSQLSRLAGVSVRTLHYYDEIGLLKPIRREDNGFREYHNKHVAILQQILLYRELDFSIDKIREILTCDHYDLLKVFDDQKLMLRERIHQAQLMITSIEATMSNVRGSFNKEILFSDIPKEKIEYWDNIRQGQGESSVSQSMVNALGTLTDSEAQRFRTLSDNFHVEYAKVMDMSVESEAVQAQVTQHYKIMNSLLYRVYEGFKGIGYHGYMQLASQILDDKVTFEIHEHYSKGLAKHLHNAMLYFAENTLKENLDVIRKLGSGRQL